MTTADSRPGSRSRRRRLARAGLLAAAVLTVVFLSVGIPSAQEARWARRCAELGGRLEQVTEDVQPLVAARTVYRCYGSDGQLVATW